MSNRVNIVTWWGVLGVLLGACHDESLLSSPQGEEVEICLTAQLAEVTTSYTKANTTFWDALDGLSVGVYGVREVGRPFADNLYLQNRKLEYNSVTRQLTNAYSKLYLPSGKTATTLYAYAPYTDDARADGDEVKIPVRGAYCEPRYVTVTRPDDPLYATAACSSTRSETQPVAPATAHFTFTHQMARLRILLTTDNTEAGYKLQAVLLRFRQHQWGYMYLSDGTIHSGNTSAYTHTESFEDATFYQATVPQMDGSALPLDDAVLSITLRVKAGSGEEPAVDYVVYQSDGTRPINLTAGTITTVKIGFNPSGEAEALLDNQWGNNEVEFDYTD